MRTSLTAGLAAALLAATPAMSMTAMQARPSPAAPGMQVVDVAGKPVGIIQSVKDQELILKTDRHEVRLPVSSFTLHKGKLVFGMTREALNSATDALLAKAFLPGAQVHGKNGELVGSIEAINEQFVTVALQTGGNIRLPRDSIAPGPHGAVIGITVEELKRMVAQTKAETP